MRAIIALVTILLAGSALAEPIATAQKRLDDWRAYRAGLPWLDQLFNKSDYDFIEQANIRMLEEAKAAAERERRERAAAAKAKAARKPQEDALKENEAKQMRCMWNPEQLIGLSRDDLRARCGYWLDVNTNYTQSGTFEQIVFGDPSVFSGRLYVYVRNGVVTSVQKR